MQPTRRLSDDIVATAARYFTPEELCQYATESESVGNHNLAAFYGDALGLHARKVSWGEIIRQSMNGWKEVDVGEAGER